MPAPVPARRRARLRRRTRARALATVGTGLAGLAALGACDTGDGKSLREPTVAFTTTVAPPVTLNSVPLVPTSPPLATGAPITFPLDDPADPTRPEAAGFQVFGPWQEGAAIGERYTCDGDGAAPAVSWTGLPAGASELAIVLTDETGAADGDRDVHWILAGIDAGERAVLEDIVPPGAVEATNSFGSVGYAPPCPPAGDGPHAYRLTVYALNQQAELADGTPADNLLGFIEDVALGAASLTGTAAR